MTRAQQKVYFRLYFEAGVKDAEIARRAGITRQHVGKMRHGDALITDAVAMAMMEIGDEIRRANAVDYLDRWADELGG